MTRTTCPCARTRPPGLGGGGRAAEGGARDLHAGVLPISEAHHPPTPTHTTDKGSNVIWDRLGHVTCCMMASVPITIVIIVTNVAPMLISWLATFLLGVATGLVALQLVAKAIGKLGDSKSAPSGRARTWALLCGLGLNLSVPLWGAAAVFYMATRTTDEVGAGDDMG